MAHSVASLPASYESLIAYRREIRLLDIRYPPSPSAQSNVADLRFGLHKARLDEAPSFYALSYAWGTPENMQTIHVNDRPFQVRENLAQFLEALTKQLRNEHGDKGLAAIRIWCDAVCINQSDAREKSSQVAMMGDIYRSATGVYAWLGLATPESEAWFRSAEHFILRHDNCEKTDGSLACLQPWKAYKMTELRGQLRDIVQREYWQRLWIVQELTLAQKVNFLCGHTQMGRRTFELFLKCWRGGKELLAPEDTSASRHVYTLLNLRHRYLASPLDLAALTRDFSRSRCHDPRDRIYGMLAMMSREEAHRIRIDYSVPLMEILLKYANNVSDDIGVTVAESVAEENGTRAWGTLSKLSSMIEGLVPLNFGSKECLNENSESIGFTCDVRLPFDSYGLHVERSLRVFAVGTEEMLVPVDQISILPPGGRRVYVSVGRFDANDWAIVYTTAPPCATDTFMKVSKSCSLQCSYEHVVRNSSEWARGQSVFEAKLAFVVEKCRRPDTLPEYDHEPLSDLWTLDPRLWLQQIMPTSMVAWWHNGLRYVFTMNAAAVGTYICIDRAHDVLLITHDRGDRPSNGGARKTSPFEEGGWSPWQFGLEEELLDTLLATCNACLPWWMSR
ncbi:uncharacterized protein AB675_7261 [Cyphellophora attinorum]|uniref:Heterokaryon incompatibility domain-containing protein n=1 Tax=Cyphellophora attinorum TaxID=1664694 RepID=A0A0N0NIX7_9EURO|nr:uncharacterized protein AB675_7261 [Phialophora attinorum]KPI36258.1 hypothetical protein AB675_7261 [Phialophora attinorum]